MSYFYRQLTRTDRAMRREKIVAAYERGGCSRTVAVQFGVSDSLVRRAIKSAGVSRKCGRRW